MKLLMRLNLLTLFGLFLLMSGCGTTTAPLSSVEVSLGTVNADTLGTSIFVAFPPTEGLDDVEVSVQGPAGWNNSETHVFYQPATESDELTTYATLLTDVEPVTGAYTLTIKSGNSVFTKVLNLDAEKLLAKTNINRALAGSLSVSTDWDAVPEAEQYRAVVLRKRGEDYQVVNYINLLADTTDFEIPYASPANASGDEFVLELLSYSFQLSDATHLPQQLNVSSTHVPFEYAIGLADRN